MTKALLQKAVPFVAAIAVVGAMVLAAKILLKDKPPLAETEETAVSGQLQMKWEKDLEKNELVPESELDQLTIHRADKKMGFSRVLDAPVPLPYPEFSFLEIPSPLSVKELPLPPVQPLLLPSPRDIAVAALPHPDFSLGDFTATLPVKLTAKVYSFIGQKVVPLKIDEKTVFQLCPGDQQKNLVNFTLVEARRNGKIWQLAIRQSCGVAALDDYGLKRSYAFLLRQDLNAEIEQNAAPHSPGTLLHIDIEWRPLILYGQSD